MRSLDTEYVEEIMSGLENLFRGEMAPSQGEKGSRLKLNVHANDNNLQRKRDIVISAYEQRLSNFLGWYPFEILASCFLKILENEHNRRNVSGICIFRAGRRMRWRINN